MCGLIWQLLGDSVYSSRSASSNFRSIKSEQPPKQPPMKMASHFREVILRLNLLESLVPGGGRTPTRLPSADFESLSTANKELTNPLLAGT